MAKVIIENSKYSVIDDQGNIIVPFGKYKFIDEFVYGLARVKTYGIPRRTDDIAGYVNDNWEFITDEKLVSKHIEAIKEDMAENPEKYSSWGIINEYGEEVLECEYDEIWCFKKPGLYSTRFIKGENEGQIYLSDLSDEAPVAPWKRKRSDYRTYYDTYANDFYVEDDIRDKMEDDFYSGEYVPEDW